MKTAVDSNILFDLLIGDQVASASAGKTLSKVISIGQVVICSVVYAELAAAFTNQEDLAQFLHDLQLHLDEFSQDALFGAASAWKSYVTRRGKQIQCPHCGHKATFHCPTCQRPVQWRQHVLADFLVGAHASRQADALLTRDRGYYRTYFPELRLFTPELDEQ